MYQCEKSGSINNLLKVKSIRYDDIQFGPGRRSRVKLMLKSPKRIRLEKKEGLYDVRSSNKRSRSSDKDGDQ